MRRSDAITALKYTGVGASGSYNQITDLVAGEWPSCTITDFCVGSTKAVSGALAPFDDEVTMAFRGPMNIYNVAVYQPSNQSASTWSQVSSWASGGDANNLVFMNNNGGDGSGVWSVCGGSSQSYANSTWDGAAASAEGTPSGSLADGEEINIMTSTTCEELECDGFSRGTSNHGWTGSKMIVMTFDMPDSDGANIPAIWALNAQVVRAAQYGCNCRGEGGDGGCGELDVLEVLANSDTTQAISEIYSFKGATGTGSAEYFARPTSSSATWAVIFDVETDAITITELTEWDYTTTAITRSLVSGYLDASGTTVSFSSSSRRADHHRRSIFGAHRRSHHH
ncbi:uncharacterized protein LAESUDRAFT_738045 [Laetiporus sulphureus 93-53]|uniref:glucan endo-1,3-beta-D-glucosidase n=1 Tax=Laetiporus sulphureus 93-53 TaxID=1314785 RepID=A0A165D0F9_9APHY|nr:uncharacterized protein LAESUDRAFT_738045 [Laetiporus sulphureus 93-53]KZT03886.1 hypothetical protein LAESUDRAFT_738045 [Laetiporus sulphureus 93-53]